MNYGGEAADQIVRYSLDGVDHTLRISGSIAKKSGWMSNGLICQDINMNGVSGISQYRRHWCSLGWKIRTAGIPSKSGFSGEL